MRYVSQHVCSATFFFNSSEEDEKKISIEIDKKIYVILFLNRFFPPIRQENDIENTILKKSMILSLKEESILLPIQPGSVKLRL